MVPDLGGMGLSSPAGGHDKKPRPTMWQREQFRVDELHSDNRLAIEGEVYHERGEIVPQVMPP